MLSIIVNNLPDNHRRFVVAKCVENEVWYYGSEKSFEEAMKLCMNEHDMFIVEDKDILDVMEDICNHHSCCEHKYGDCPLIIPLKGGYYDCAMSILNEVRKNEQRNC